MEDVREMGEAALGIETGRSGNAKRVARRGQGQARGEERGVTKKPEYGGLSQPLFVERAVQWGRGAADEGGRGRWERTSKEEERSKAEGGGGESCGDGGSESQGLGAQLWAEKRGLRKDDSRGGVRSGVWPSPQRGRRGRGQ